MKQLIVSFVLGVVSTFLGFALNQSWQQAKERKARLEKKLSLLKCLVAELQLQKGKLERLIDDLGKTMRGDKGFFVPSYGLLPEFLAGLRKELLVFHEMSELATHLGHLYFELVHIQAKLTEYKASVTAAAEASDRERQEKWIEAALLNSRGLTQLLQSNLASFTDAVARVEKASNHTEKNRLRFLDRLFLGELLKD